MVVRNGVVVCGAVFRSNSPTLTRPFPPIPSFSSFPLPPIFREHYTHVGGFRVRYLDGGSGPPVVLVPTMFLPADSYRPTMAHLSQSYRVFAVDTPGTGKSQPLRERWAFERYADWVAEFLGVLGLEPVPVIGHSNAGGLVLVLAAGTPGGSAMRSWPTPWAPTGPTPSGG